ncbi:MAG: pilus assembly protein [Rhodobacteraceae bacterium]|nr:pilus assembly protein [Paracoccaceae bacterium]
MLTALWNRAKSFAKDTEGAVSVEFALAMPIIFWAFAGVYVFFDGYRQSTVNLKAAYTISDLLSRETEDITETYVTSMHSLLQVLTRTGSDAQLRVSVVRWDEDDDRYEIVWSRVRGGYGNPLSTASVAELEDKLPVMPNDEVVVLVETRNVFEPVFNIGMDDKNLENFVFTRLRFGPQLNFDQNG